MAKKQSASSRPGKRVVKSEADIRAYAKTAAFQRAVERARAIRDSDIDFSDIPELTDEELDRMVRARAARLRKLKRPISIRLEPAVLDWLKRNGPGYQTRINELLREAMERSEKNPQTRDDLQVAQDPTERIDREVETPDTSAPMQVPKAAPHDTILQTLLQERERLNRAIESLSSVGRRRGRPSGATTTPWAVAAKRRRENQRGENRRKRLLPART